MKKILLIALLAFGMSAKAQITLLHTYDSASTITGNSQLMLINFQVSGERYVKINRLDQSICIYDLNHSLLKTISLASLPLFCSTPPRAGEVLYLSQNLFTTDSKIAFMYIRNPCGIPSPYYITDIVNEDGTILFSDTGSAEIIPNYEEQQMPIYNTSQGTIMILSYRNGQAKVFGLPGILSESIIETNNTLISQSKISNPYPNPTSNSTSIDYELPKGINEGEIVFYNLQGNEIKRFKVDRTFSTLLVSTNDIAAGTYLYQLQTTAQSSEGKKMVVIK